MSNFNFNEWLEEHQGQVNWHSQLAAVVQRNQQIKLQEGQATALRQQTVAMEQQKLALQQQTAALEKQNRIEQNRARFEQQRLHIESQRLDLESKRLAADEADREMRRQRTEQLKEMRNLIAETKVSLVRFRKQNLA